MSKYFRYINMSLDIIAIVVDVVVIIIKLRFILESHATGRVLIRFLNRFYTESGWIVVLKKNSGRAVLL